MSNKKEGNIILEEIIYQENAVLNLQRSNFEMNEFDKDDKDFILAIEENKKIIEKKKKRIKELKELLPKDELEKIEIDDTGIDL